MNRKIQKMLAKSPLFKIAFTASVLSICALTERSLAEQAQPPIKSIAVIPVSEPTWYSLKNRNALEIVLSPLIGVGTAIDSRSKAQVFTDKMSAQQPYLGEELTKALIAALNRQGYNASRLEGLQRLRGDEESIDYAEVKSDADAVLHVYFTDVGVFSGYSTVDYLPKVNIYGYLFNPKDGEYIHEETVYYGDDARTGKSWGVTADPNFKFPSFDSLIERASDVKSGFNNGAGAAGERLAQNIRNHLSKAQ